MKKSIKKLMALALVLAMAMTAFGCASKTSDSSTNNTTTQPAEQKEQKPVVIMTAANQNSLDPYHSGSIVEANIFEHVLEALVTHDVNNQIVPRLATEWKNVDSKTWEFKLRNDVKFHDGKPLTSADVKFSFDRAMDQKTKTTGNYGWILASINVEKVEAPDEYTVRIVTKDPVPVLLTYLAEFYIVPKHFYEGKDDTFLQTNMLGSGPYKFIEWKKNQYISLEVNPNYWGEKAKIQKLIFKSVPEASTRVAELITEGADIVDKIPPDMESQLKEGTSLIKLQGGARLYIGFVQYGNPAIKDKRVRQALNYAVDFDTILKTLLGGVGKRTGTFVNPPWADPNITPYPYDLQKAKSLLKEAGYEDRNNDGVVEDKSGKPLRLVLQTPKGRYVKDIEMSQAIASDIKKAGVIVDVKPMEWSVYVGQLDEKKLEGDMFLIGSGSTFEGQSDISDLEASNSSNYGQWKNEEFQKLYKELGKEFDEAKRHELLNKMQAVMKEDAAILYLYFQPVFYGVSDRLNWQPSSDGRIRLTNADFK